MTKKRFKFGLAVLGVLGIFFMALLALVFAPSLASADKSTGLGHHPDGESQSSHHNPVYFALYDSPDSGPGHRGAHDPGNHYGDYCALNHCETGGDDSNHQDHQAPGNQNGGQSGGNPQGGQGNGLGNGQGGGGTGQGPFAGGGFGGPGGGFGGPGGYFAPGAPGNGSNNCNDNKNTCDKDTGGQDSQGGQGSNGDGSHNSDGTDNHQDGTPNGQPGNPSNGPSGNGQDPQSGPSDFTITDTTGGDPTGGGPTGDNPPATLLTDAPVQVPEPFTLSLFTVGLGGAALLRRRSRGRKAA